MSKYLVFIGIGFELIVAILVAQWIADELEKRWPSKGMIALAIYFAVITAWFVHIFYLLKETKKDENSP